MTDIRIAQEPPFRAGDDVFMPEGPCQGTPGVFLALGEDANWAEIRQRGGAVKRHPVIWMRHAGPETREPVLATLPPNAA